MSQGPSRKNGAPKRGPLAFFWLLLGIGLVALFMFVLAPAGQRALPGFDAMGRFVDRTGLRATAFYYTDIDEFGEASISLRNRLEYSPADMYQPSPTP
jgi:hypothetical protein